MKIIPSIDIKNGKCVKLVGGKPGSGRIISENPMEVALEWERLGAERLHLVDLDAAIYGGKGNRETIIKIVKRLNIPVEVGGGIRSLEDAGELLKAGVKWVIFGTAVLKNPEAVYGVVKTYGAERVIIALDSIREKILIEGWTKETSTTTLEILKAYERLRVYAFLYTDVEVEGTLGGVKFEGVKRVVEASKRPIIYAGGVSSLEDLKKLKKAGVMGVVVGRALYEGKFTLKEAKEAGSRT